MKLRAIHSNSKQLTPLVLLVRLPVAADQKSRLVLNSIDDGETAASIYSDGHTCQTVSDNQNQRNRGRPTRTAQTLHAYNHRTGPTSHAVHGTAAQHRALSICYDGLVCMYCMCFA
jgi:hypothetical protein